MVDRSPFAGLVLPLLVGLSLACATLPVPAQDRTVDDVDTPAANAVVRVGGCTGTLITERLILTAAHCVGGLVVAPPPDLPPSCIGLEKQKELQGKPAWQDPMAFHPIPRNRRTVIRFGANENFFGLGIRATEYSLPYCADMALLRLAHPVPSGVAMPLPVLVGLGDVAEDRFDWTALRLRHSGWGEAKQNFHEDPTRRVGPVQPWTDNRCILFTLPPERVDGRRIVNGDSGSPLIATDAEGRDFVIAVIFGRGIPDAETCGVPRLRIPQRHGSYTPTWRGAIAETDATPLGAWLAHHAPEAALLWSDLSPSAE